jgi:O-acetyl-ADP-ribose deacetylase (regulator of RNase III)
MKAYVLHSGRQIVMQHGDITCISADAIVNAANERMLGGDGVDGAIHAGAGPRLREACEAVPEVRPGVRCPRGEARVTPAFNLRAKHVIHTVGPYYESDEASAPMLRRAHESCLVLAASLSVRSIAFPAISCGVYGYPSEAAARVAISTVAEFEAAPDSVSFVLFSMTDYDRWVRVATELLAAHNP